MNNDPFAGMPGLDEETPVSGADPFADMPGAEEAAPASDDPVSAFRSKLNNPREYERIKKWAGYLGTTPEDPIVQQRLTNPLNFSTYSTLNQLKTTGNLDEVNDMTPEGNTAGTGLRAALTQFGHAGGIFRRRNDALVSRIAAGQEMEVGDTREPSAQIATGMAGMPRPNLRTFKKLEDMTRAEQDATVPKEIVDLVNQYDTPEAPLDARTRANAIYAAAKSSATAREQTREMASEELALREELTGKTGGFLERAGVLAAKGMPTVGYGQTFLVGGALGGAAGAFAAATAVSGADKTSELLAADINPDTGEVDKQGTGYDDARLRGYGYGAFEAASEQFTGKVLGVAFKGMDMATGGYVGKVLSKGMDTAARQMAKTSIGRGVAALAKGIQRIAGLQALENPATEGLEEGIQQWADTVFAQRPSDTEVPVYLKNVLNEGTGQIEQVQVEPGSDEELTAKRMLSRYGDKSGYAEAGTRQMMVGEKTKEFGKEFFTWENMTALAEGFALQYALTLGTGAMQAVQTKEARGVIDDSLLAAGFTNADIIRMSDEKKAEAFDGFYGNAANRDEFAKVFKDAGDMLSQSAQRAIDSDRWMRTGEAIKPNFSADVAKERENGAATVDDEKSGLSVDYTSTLEGTAFTVRDRDGMLSPMTFNTAEEAQKGAEKMSQLKQGRQADMTKRAEVATRVAQVFAPGRNVVLVQSDKDMKAAATAEGADPAKYVSGAPGLTTPNGTLIINVAAANSFDDLVKTVKHETGHSVADEAGLTKLMDGKTLDGIATEFQKAKIIPPGAEGMSDFVKSVESVRAQYADRGVKLTDAAAVAEVLSMRQEGMSPVFRKRFGDGLVTVLRGKDKSAENMKDVRRAVAAIMYSGREAKVEPYGGIDAWKAPAPAFSGDPIAADTGEIAGTEAAEPLGATAPEAMPAQGEEAPGAEAVAPDAESVAKAPSVTTPEAEAAAKEIKAAFERKQKAEAPVEEPAAPVDDEVQRDWEARRREAGMTDDASAPVSDRPTRHRVFEGGSPIRVSNPKALRATDQTKAYRLTSQAQVDDMLASGGVRAREGKMKGGHSGEVHWSAGHETLGYNPRDGAYVIETPVDALNDRGGSLPNAAVKLWRSENGAWTDVSHILAPAKAKPTATASIPVMITKKMEADLRAGGVSQADINKMTPQQANDRLAELAKKPALGLDGGTPADIAADAAKVEAQRKKQEERDEIAKKAAAPLKGDMGDTTPPLPGMEGVAPDDLELLNQKPKEAQNADQERGAKEVAGGKQARGAEADGGGDAQGSEAARTAGKPEGEGLQERAVEVVPTVAKQTAIQPSDPAQKSGKAPKKEIAPKPRSPAERAIGDSPMGVGKYAGTLVKDLFGKDPAYALWAADNFSGSKRAKEIAGYLRGSPEYAAEGAAQTAPLAVLDTAENRDLLKKHGLTMKATGATVTIGGSTYGYKDIIKTAGGRFGVDNVWRIAGGKAAGLLDALRGVPAVVVGPRGKSADYIRNSELSRLRETLDGRPDRGKFDRPAGEYVGEDTQALLRKGVAAGIPADIVTEQIEDVAKIKRVYDANDDRRLFILASEPGSGKTFVLGAAIRELRRSGAKRIVYVTMRSELIDQIKGDLAEYGMDGVEFMTYPVMRDAPNIGASDVLIFDEAHSIKNVDSADGARQAKMAKKWIEKARFTILSTATPFENPVQAAYMEPTGVFAAAGGFVKWAKAYGAHTLKIGKGVDAQVVLTWQRTLTSDGDAKAARNFFMREGVFTSRPIRLAPGMAEARLSKITADREITDIYNAISRAAENNEDSLQGFAAAWIINFKKRLLEAAKVQRGIEEAKSAIGRGRNPIIFVETKAERTIDIPDLLDRERQWAMAVEEARSQHDRPPPRSAFGLPPVGVTDVLEEFMDETGRAVITIPSAEDVIVEALGKDNVAVFTGSVTPKVAQRNLAEWRAGAKRTIVATMAKGGTGLSLHDKVGDHPTTQIVVNLPWTATQVKQVAQRNARYGLKSNAEINWIFADNIPFDRELAAKVGGRMADMGASVYGDAIVEAQQLEDWDFQHATFSEQNAALRASPDVSGEKGAESPVADAPRFKLPGVTLDAEVDAARAQTGTPEFKKEYDAVVIAYKGTDKWLRAPNGKPTKLNERQWVQVRTPSFKAWFGDWEKYANGKDGNGVWVDSDNAVSKVVDDNGEPLVVFHGTTKFGFTEIDPYKADKHRSPMVFASNHYGTARSYSNGGYIEHVKSLEEEVTDEVKQYASDQYGWEWESDEERDALWDGLSETQKFDAIANYRSENGEEDMGRGVYPLFLNIRDPLESNFEGRNWDGASNGLFQVTNEEGEVQYDDSGKGVFTDDEAETFAKALSEKTGDSYKWDEAEGGETTNSVAEDALRFKNDGAIIRNVLDDGGRGGFADVADVYVFFKAGQAKSALDNTGEFGSSNDIRFRLPGVTLDAEYMRAVEKGDRGGDNLVELLRKTEKDERDKAVAAWLERNPETAERLEKMVVDRARAAGYDIKAYHATNNDFNVFDRGRLGSETAKNSPPENGMALSKLGFWFHEKPLAKELGQQRDVSAFIRLGESDDKSFDELWDNPEMNGDSLVVDDSEFGGKSYVIRDSTQIKLADPVTRDDAGRIIPLSERFNEASDDIRYRLPGIDTPEFKAWFKDSKVVDSDGKPLVVYHGTAKDFTAFDLRKMDGRSEGPGFYFTNNRSVASGYGRPMDVYLSLQKPMAYDTPAFNKKTLTRIMRTIATLENAGEGGDIRDGYLANFGDTYSKGIEGALREGVELVAADKSALDQISGLVGSGVSAEYVLRAVTAVTGYDGIVAKGFSNEGDESNTIYVAFRPEQIKSATGNAGTFDPANADIRYRLPGVSLDDLSAPVRVGEQRTQSQLENASDDPGFPILDHIRGGSKIIIPRGLVGKAKGEWDWFTEAGGLSAFNLTEQKAFFRHPKPGRPNRGNLDTLAGELKFDNAEEFANAFLMEVERSRTLYREQKERQARRRSALAAVSEHDFFRGKSNIAAVMGRAVGSVYASMQGEDKLTLQKIRDSEGDDAVRDYIIQNHFERVVMDMIEHYAFLEGRDLEAPSEIQDEGTYARPEAVNKEGDTRPTFQQTKARLETLAATFYAPVPEGMSPITDEAASAYVRTALDAGGPDWLAGEAEKMIDARLSGRRTAPLNKYETAVLLWYQTHLDQQTVETDRQAQEATDVNDISNLKSIDTARERIHAKTLDYLTAARQYGSLAGQALQSLKLRVDHGFNIVKIYRQAYEDNGDMPLTRAQHEKLRARVAALEKAWSDYVDAAGAPTDAAELEKRVAELEAKLKDLGATGENLTGIIETLAKKRETLQAEYAKQTAGASELSEKKAGLEAEIVKLEQEIALREGLNQDVAALQEKVSELTARLDALELEYAGATPELLSSLKKQLADLTRRYEAKLAEYEKIKEDLKTATERLKRTRKLIEKLGTAAKAKIARRRVVLTEASNLYGVFKQEMEKAQVERLAARWRGAVMPNDLTFWKRVGFRGKQFGNRSTIALAVTRDLIRALQSMGDESVAGRQLAKLGLAHPILWSRAFAQSQQLVFTRPAYDENGRPLTWTERSDRALFELDQMMREHPMYDVLVRKGGLSWMDLTADPASFDEQQTPVGPLLRSMLPRWTGVGLHTALLEVSNNHYAGMSNMLRFAAACRLYEKWNVAKGETPTEEDIQAIVSTVDIFGGRGNVTSKKAKDFMAAAGHFLYSPRLALSNVQFFKRMLGFVGDPGTSAKAKAMIATEYLWLGVNYSVISILARLVSKMLSDDPDEQRFQFKPGHSAFLTLMFGQRRLDISGGAAMWARSVSQILGLGDKLDIETGLVTQTGKSFTREYPFIDLGDRQNLDYNSIGRLVRSKMDPWMGMMTDLVSGKNYSGQAAGPLAKPHFPDYGMRYPNVLKDIAPIPLGFQSLVSLLRGDTEQGVAPLRNPLLLLDSMGAQFLGTGANSLPVNAELAQEVAEGYTRNAEELETLNNRLQGIMSDRKMSPELKELRAQRIQDQIDRIRGL